MSYRYSIPHIDTIELDKRLEKIEKTNTVIIYGAARCGYCLFLYLMYRGYRVSFYVDRNLKAQERNLFFVETVSFEEFRERYAGEEVLIATYKDDVFDELKNSIEVFVREDKIIKIPVSLQTGVMPLPEDYSKPRLKLSRVDSESKLPQLTVISVIYNTPEMYLRRAIESVLTQSYTNFRYLIIDHGSDDGVTSKVISEYSELDKRINVIRTEKNYVNELRAGRCEDMSELHSIVFDNVSTKYTCMIDSDDCFADGYFETAYNLLEKEDADVYFMGAISYAENTFDKGDFWASFNLPPCDRIAVTEEEKIFNYANAYASIGGWGMMCKTGLFREAYRRVWANGKITSDLKAGYYVAMKASKSIYGKDVCLYYVNRENAVSTALKRKILERLDNVVGLVLQERLCEMRTSLIEKKLDYKKILYNYTDYNLKVLIQYIEAINAEELDSATKEFVFKILKSLISDCYVEEVLKSRRYCEFEVQMNKFCEV